MPVNVLRRSSVPSALQANKALLLKAMSEARSSVQQLASKGLQGLISDSWQKSQTVLEISQVLMHTVD